MESNQSDFEIKMCFLKKPQKPWELQLLKMTWVTCEIVYIIQNWIDVNWFLIVFFMLVMSFFFFIKEENVYWL